MIKFNLFAGKGTTIVAAIQEYVRSHPLPPVPEFAGGYRCGRPAIIRGMDQIQGPRRRAHRHAVWGDRTGPQPAADAPASMRWLSIQSRRSCHPIGIRRSRKGRARRPAQGNGLWRGRLPRPPSLPPLLFGKLPDYLDHRLQGARQVLKGFDAHGIHRYRPAPDKPDFARTLGADHANGLSATSLENILEASALVGDPDLTRQALALLDRQTELYARSVPRGAQPWEMPLHTPDILGSRPPDPLLCPGFPLQANPNIWMKRDIGRGPAWPWLS